MGNVEKCMSFMCDGSAKKDYNDVVLGITTEGELMFKLNLLPEESKKIIVAKWGLDGTKLCSTYKSLDAKLGISNSREVYTMALMDLSRSSWIVSVDDEGKVKCIFKDYSPSEFNLAVSCGKLRFLASRCHRRYAYHRNPVPYDGTVHDFAFLINTALNKLSEREANVIRHRCGFYDGSFKSLEETGRECGVTRECVRQIEVKAFRRLSCSNIVPKS